MELCAQAEDKFLAVGADLFAASRGKFESVMSWLRAAETLQASHSELEARLKVDCREIFQQLLQDHLGLRAKEEPRRLLVVGDEGVERREVINSGTGLDTIFGEVGVGRLAYRAPREGVGNLMPLDGELNLPAGTSFSFGLQRLAAEELAKSSFEEIREAVLKQTGVNISKGRLETLTASMAQDFQAFYGEGSNQAQAGSRAVFGEDSKDPDGFDPTKLLVITTDGKGVRVVEEDLREATRKAAQKARNQRKCGNPMEEQIPRRKSQKRMGQVCAVYTVAPFPRTPEDIIRNLRHICSQ